jgi:hypothetical protein
MATMTSFPVRPDSAAWEREMTEMAGVIEEIWHSAPLLAYVEHEGPHEQPHEREEPDWPLDPAILHGLVHP